MCFTEKRELLGTRQPAWNPGKMLGAWETFVGGVCVDESEAISVDRQLCLPGEVLLGSQGRVGQFERGVGSLLVNDGAGGELVCSDSLSRGAKCYGVPEARHLRIPAVCHVDQTLKNKRVMPQLLIAMNQEGMLIEDMGWLVGKNR